jgi:hypothetical protein
MNPRFLDIESIVFGNISEVERVLGSAILFSFSFSADPEEQMWKMYDHKVERVPAQVQNGVTKTAAHK